MSKHDFLNLFMFINIGCTILKGSVDPVIFVLPVTGSKSV